LRRHRLWLGWFSASRDFLSTKTKILLNGTARRWTTGPSTWFLAPLSLARFESSPRACAIVKVLAAIGRLCLDEAYDFADDLLTRPASIQKLPKNSPNSLIILRVYTFREFAVELFEFPGMVHDHPYT
jgi:hypothetical protein